MQVQDIFKSYHGNDGKTYYNHWDCDLKSEWEIQSRITWNWPRISKLFNIQHQHINRLVVFSIYIYIDNFPKNSFNIWKYLADNYLEEEQILYSSTCIKIKLVLFLLRYIGQYIQVNDVLHFVKEKKL